MTFHRTLVSSAGLGALAVLTACSSAPRRDEVAYNPVPVMQAPISSEYGEVQSVDLVPIASRPSGAGAILGAIVGGVVGNQFGAGAGRALATGAGVVGGAVAGNAIERRQKRDDEVFRVGIRFNNGSYRDFDFRDVGDLRVGDRVKLEGGQIYRV
jgi:outer membrane lipoprotein SlyB